MPGRKTYVIAGLIGLATAVKYMGYIDDEIYKMILGFLGAGGLAALRAGVKKSGR